ncbi:hypothetical protein V8F20_003426 [Naviculisporaceae sp. PSN 640]
MATLPINATWEAACGDWGDATNGDWDNATSSRKTPRSNTLLITNLPPDVNEKTLLDRITRAGPIGKLYSLHLDTTNPFEPTGRPIPHARLAFFNFTESLLLRNLIQSQSIALHGWVLEADWAQSKMVPEDDDPAIDPLPNPSRVVLVTGPDFVVTKNNLLTKIQETGLVPYHRILEVEEKQRKRTFAVLFTTYSMAKRATRILRNRKNDVTAVYGRDPMETGVKVVVDSCNPNGLAIEYPDWRANGTMEENLCLNANDPTWDNDQDEGLGLTFGTSGVQPTSSNRERHVTFKLPREDSTTGTVQNQGQRDGSCVLM